MRRLVHFESPEGTAQTGTQHLHNLKCLKNYWFVEIFVLKWFLELGLSSLFCYCPFRLSSQSDNVNESIMLSGFPIGTFIHLLIPTDIVTTVSHEPLEQFR